MYKEQLLQNMQREIDLLKQLAPVIKESDLHFRPHEKVRSTLELMQYLSGLGAVMMRWLVKNDITPEDWVKIREYRSTLTQENFMERLDQQSKDIAAYFDMITDEDLITKDAILPSKETMKLGAAIINAPIKWMASYRMQLFLNLKINGNVDLGTKDAWIMAEVPAEVKA